MGYNTGDSYEEKIFDICDQKGIIPLGSHRAGASAEDADLVFLHLNNFFKLEIKNNQNPDYGQRRIHFDPANKTWSWARKDRVTDFYQALNLVQHIDPHYHPTWYKKRAKNLNGIFREVEPYSMNDFKFDQRSFENPNIPIPTQALFNYYAHRNTFYIQIEGSGFYHLQEDIALLGTKQYDGTLTMRFRVKHAGHGKNPPHACQFMGVLKQDRVPSFSRFNIEENRLQQFPNIK